MNQAGKDIVTKVKIEGAEKAIAAIHKLTADLKKMNGKDGDTPPAPPVPPAS